MSEYKSFAEATAIRGSVPRALSDGIVPGASLNIYQAITMLNEIRNGHDLKEVLERYRGSWKRTYGAEPFFEEAERQALSVIEEFEVLSRNWRVQTHAQES